MKKINLIEILFHFIATCFFIFSARKFSGIYNIKVLKITLENRIESIVENPQKYGLTDSDIWNFPLAISIFTLIAISVAFLISILISIKKKWSVINSIIVLIITLTMNKFGVFEQIRFTKYISPWNLIDDLMLKLTISAIFLLAIGCIIFFSKFLNNKIETYSKK